ncbi:MAG: PQQ-dependent sugar dehydrogenase [Bacteroidia bacterium]
MKKRYSILLVPVACILFATCKKDPDLQAKHLAIEVFVKNLQNPWGMEFLPNGDFLFCERTGQINLKKAGEGDYNLIMFRSVQVAEGGLLGLAIDPDFEANHFVYIYETVVGYNQVVRLKMENDVLTQDQIILTGIPAANNHDGGALRFGPDGYLYLGTGDAQVPSLAQDTSSLAGKILRIDRYGNAAPGNPFNSRIWTWGHRNVQGFDWNKNGKMIATEHGPTIEFGWCCHDEINLIEPGKNYGWPIAIGGTESDSLTPAIYQTGYETWAPSGCTFIKGKEWGSWENDFIFGALKEQRLVHFDISADGTIAANRQDTLIGTFQRLRNIIQAPDGSLLFSSSNIGTTSPPPLAGDDKIYRLYWTY